MLVAQFSDGALDQYAKGPRFNPQYYNAYTLYTHTHLYVQLGDIVPVHHVQDPDFNL